MQKMKTIVIDITAKQATSPKADETSPKPVRKFMFRHLPDKKSLADDKPKPAVFDEFTEVKIDLESMIKIPEVLSQNDSMLIADDYSTKHLASMVERDLEVDVRLVMGKSIVKPQILPDLPTPTERLPD